MTEETKAPEENEETKKNDFEITAEATLIGDLMSLLLDEIKVLKKPWQELGQAEQQYALDRMQESVTDATGKAMRFIAVAGQQSLAAEVEQVVFKDGCKAVLKPSFESGLRHELADHVGSKVLIVFPGTESLGSQDVPKAEPDQASLVVDEDPLIDQAIETVRADGNASISHLQRALKIGYNRAARIIERMEALGIVSAIMENGARDILPESEEQDGEENTDNKAA